MIRTAAALLVSATALLLLAGPRKPPAVIRLELIDAAQGQPRAGLVRVLDPAGKAIKLPGLLCRGDGLGEDSPLRDWYAVIGQADLSVPAGKIRVEALAGLETERAGAELNLRPGAVHELVLPLRRFSRVAEEGWRSANTHLHLTRLDKATAERYVTEVPAPDDLDVLFLSYLERAGDDVHYISNRFPIGELEQFSRGRVLVSNGEEHRHNFGSHGEGYGHVMLLGIDRLVEPVSIGPGIAQRGTDGIPLRDGIADARAQGGTVLWCHNNWGLEDVAGWVAGWLDAQNIFDGSAHGTYADSFYRYLNVGLEVPFSTGTDWFLYDLSRVYAAARGSLTTQAWLDALAAGRSFITNGPLLDLRVEGRPIGARIELAAVRKVRVEGSARGRVDFGRIELVRNGEVIARAASRPVAGHFRADLGAAVEIERPCWLALRIPPPPVPQGDDGSAGRKGPAHPHNVFGRPLFAHTSPIYLSLSGRKVFQPVAAGRLLADLVAAKQTILQMATFADPAEKRRVLGVYDEAAEQLRRRISAHQPK
ncbi:MAG: CehA/McbA family metallohydrolase [Pirellulales bacterium]